MAGIHDNSTAIWLAALTASFNFLFTIVGLLLVDRVGRRPLSLGSLLGTSASLALLAVSFQLAASHSPKITFDPSSDNSTSCQDYS